MLLCSCRKMCTFAAKIAQNRLTNMNFVFISPHFPHTYWQFCQWLYQNGVKVLGIADVHSHEEVLSRYGDRIVMCERMPELFSSDGAADVHRQAADDGRSK